MIDLFIYMDYRKYLTERYTEEKKAHRHFSYRYFARVAGISSPGYLKMVMNGERNLSPSTINKFSKALKFSRREAAYFEALVLFNQAREDKERDLYFERVSAIRPVAKIEGLKKDQYEYFTHKHFVVIREMVALPHFREDPEWIASRLSPPIKPKEVEHALAVLLRLGLIKKDETGRLAHTEASVTTPPEVDSIEVYNFHRAMLNDAKEAMLNLPPEERDITSLTIPVPKSALGEVKKRIQDFREEIINFINKGSDHYHEVYQLNAQLFPVTNTKGGD